MASIPIRSRILIIEDDAKMARSLSEGVIAQGFEVKTAITGEEGFFLVYNFHPHVILLDLNLPGGEVSTFFGKSENRPSMFVCWFSPHAMRLKNG